MHLFFLFNIITFSKMFIVFTQPNKFTKTYTEAVQIAEDHYQLTGEIVAVERSEHHEDYRTNYYLNST